MALFLNTTKLLEWLPRLISETEKELVIVVPYIQISNTMLRHLIAADKRGVDTVLVYREKKVSNEELKKFEKLQNLSLFHHPNIHCKCNYNEKYVLITSMNLYEYSEKNNREMGVLLHKEDLRSPGYPSDDEPLFEEVIEEVKAIIKGSHLERKSKKVESRKFDIDILKSAKDKALDKCRVLSEVFAHKSFEPELVGTTWLPVCRNYFDRVQVAMDYRIQIDLDFDEDRRKVIFERFRPNNREFLIPGFKLYWNHPTASIYLYVDGKNEMWRRKDAERNKYSYGKSAIDQFISVLRTCL